MIAGLSCNGATVKLSPLESQNLSDPKHWSHGDAPNPLSSFLLHLGHCGSNMVTLLSSFVPDYARSPHGEAVGSCVLGLLPSVGQALCVCQNHVMSYARSNSEAHNGYQPPRN
jgi:hypothetical protein